MSDEFVNPLESPAAPPADGGPEASAPPAGSAGATERRRSRSGVEPADPAPAPPEARPASGFVGRPEPDDDDRWIADDGAEEGARDAAPSLPPLARTRSRSPSLSKPVGKAEALRPEQRLLLLDTWLRSGLPAGDFAALVGLSKFTLFAWKKKFAEEGPAGLMDKPKGGPSGSRLPELTRRTILMLKESNPEWGCQRISDLMLRGPALPASAAAVARVLHEAGYSLEEVPTRPHPATETHFERAKPNQLWQTDLFTFVLKRQNRRVYLVAFLDDHSRFLVGYGLHASQSAALVEVVFQVRLQREEPEARVVLERLTGRHRSLPGELTVFEGRDELVGVRDRARVDAVAAPAAALALGDVARGARRLDAPAPAPRVAGVKPPSPGRPGPGPARRRGRAARSISSRRRAKKVASLTPRAAQKARTDWPDACQAATVSRQNCSRAWLRRRIFGMGRGLLAGGESPDPTRSRKTPHDRTFTVVCPPRLS